MKLDALRLFRAVARAGSITAGARALGLGQSSGSSTLAQLEQQLGTPLFHRGGRGVSLTQAGERLLVRAEALLAQADDLVAELRAMHDEAVGSFVLGCHDALGGYFLPHFLPHFLDEHPRIEIRLWNRSSAEVRQAILDRDVHVGLVVNTAPHDDLVIQRAWSDRIEVFGTTGGPGVEGLASGTLVYPDREPFLSLLRRLEDAGLSPARRLPCGDLGLTRTLAASLGYGLLPRRVALDGDQRLVPLGDLPGHDDVIHLVARADLPRTRASRVFREALLRSARALD